MVVVYKIDRLSRSLFDFAKIVELFEKHEVSFVSVTQSFNTSTSMGKLMLNILLSFAQFEREVTSERIRDKVAASKKLGIWMGGYPLLGYNVENRKLVINEEESAIVKYAFEQFEISESCTMVADLLNRKGFRTKVRAHANRHCGGKLFSAKEVRKMLTNPYYKGYVTHKGEIYKGEHQAIIDEKVWDHIQTIFKKIDSNQRKAYNSSTPSFLKGIFKCEKCGTAMTPSFSYNHGLRYRYYTCSNHVKHKSCLSKFKRVPAEDIEQKVSEEIIKILRSPEIIMNINKLVEKDTTISQNILRENLTSALNNLTEVWTYLYPIEQQKICKMLIDVVTISDSGLKIKMNFDGFDKIMMELLNGVMR